MAGSGRGRVGPEPCPAAIVSKFLQVSMSTAKTLAFGALLALLPGAAAAHSFGRLYNLPVPFWLYAYGASAALLLSFLIAGYFLRAAPSADRPERQRPAPAWLLRVRPWLGGLSLFMLALCIATGLFGSRNPYLNFNMTFFWVVFTLGFVYLAALIGDFFGPLNPWRALAQGIGRVWRGFVQGRRPYPQRLAYWPALALYMGFIWIELLMHNQPVTLAWMLLGYTAITLGGVWLYGAAAWFRYGEFLSVFFRLVGHMAPVAYREGRIVLRAPFSGLLRERAEHGSLLVFVLFMLSSTAFDGLRATVPWIKLFWQDPFNILTPMLGRPPIYFYAQLRPWYEALETVTLLLSPFIYLGVYLLFIALSRRLGRSPLSLRELALRFGFSLLPIALVYHVTHYYTLLITQGVKVFSMISDPFGWGWNLLGTARLWRTPILPDLAWVWHSQVALILLGHIVSVVIAHLEALRVFETPRRAALSQLPMLVLMVLFTTFGLWILAQPIQSGM